MSRHRLAVLFLKELRETLLRMGGRAEAILEKSLNAVWKHDKAAAAA